MCETTPLTFTVEDRSIAVGVGGQPDSTVRGNSSPRRSAHLRPAPTGMGPNRPQNFVSHEGVAAVHLNALGTPNASLWPLVGGFSSQVRIAWFRTPSHCLPARGRSRFEDRSLNTPSRPQFAAVKRVRTDATDLTPQQPPTDVGAVCRRRLDRDRLMATHHRISTSPSKARLEPVRHDRLGWNPHRRPMPFALANDREFRRLRRHQDIWSSASPRAFSRP